MGSGSGQAVPNVGGKDLDDVVAHGNLLYLNDSGGNQVKVVKPDGVIVPIEKYRPGQKPSKKKSQNNDAQESVEKQDPQNTPDVPQTPEREQPRNNNQQTKNDDQKKNDDKPERERDDPAGDKLPNTPVGNDNPAVNNPLTPVGGDEGDPVAPDPEAGAPDPEADPVTDPEPESEPEADPTQEAAGPPEAPIVAQPTPEDQAALITWQGAQDRGSEITGYAVVVDNQVVVEVGADRRNYRLTELTNGQQYGVQIRALSAEGDGDLSPVAYVTPSADLPGTPGGINATAGDGQVRVAWNAAEAGRTAVTGYTVAAVTTNGGRTTQDANGTQYTFTGLTNGTGYVIEVRARSAGGEGEVGKPADGQPGSDSNPVVPAGKPGAPKLGTPVPGAGSAKISWDAAADGGSAITGYQVQVGTGAIQDLGANVREYTAQNLSSSGATVKVRAVNAHGQGEWASTTAKPTELKRKQMYQCRNVEVTDIYMLDLDTDCNNPQANRWESATPIFKALSTQQPGTVQLMRCMITKPRGIIRQQLQTCPAGSETNGGTAFWAWTSANASGTEIREYKWSGSANGGYYYAPAGQGAPSGYAATGRKFWT
nr:fibronectin type III domain-containing protein [Kineosporia babensis]